MTDLTQTSGISPAQPGSRRAPEPLRSLRLREILQGRLNAVVLCLVNVDG
jgi:hypothetical protein